MNDTPPEQPDKKTGKSSPFTVIENGKDEAAEEAAPKDEFDGVNDEALMLKLAELEQEHRDLDHAIATLEERMPYDRLTLQRMKKRKLLLKDRIFELKDKLEPDIIA